LPVRLKSSKGKPSGISQGTRSALHQSLVSIVLTALTQNRKTLALCASAIWGIFKNLSLLELQLPHLMLSINKVLRSSQMNIFSMMSVHWHLPSASPLCPCNGSNNPTSNFRSFLNPTCRIRVNPPRAQANDASDSNLDTQFARLVNERDAAGLSPSSIQRRGPSHLLSPPLAVAAILNALQRNDWPDVDAGVETAFSFTKPWTHGGELSSVAPRRVRSWAALENFLDLKEFSNHLHSPPYKALLEIDEWHAAAPLVFPSSRSENKAVQAVTLKSSKERRNYNFTFCLEKQLVGSMKGCWLVAGVRQGNYST